MGLAQTTKLTFRGEKKTKKIPKKKFIKRTILRKVKDDEGCPNI